MLGAQIAITRRVIVSMKLISTDVWNDKGTTGKRERKRKGRGEGVGRGKGEKEKEWRKLS